MASKARAWAWPSSRASSVRTVGPVELEAESPQRQRLPSRTSPPSRLDPLMARILIVEDEPAIVVSLEEDFRRQGYETTVATDGAEGIERGKAGPGI